MARLKWLLQRALCGYGKHRATLLALLVTLIVAAAHHGGLLEQPDLFWRDFLVRYYSPERRGLDPDIVLVEITEESFRSLGVLPPLPRRFLVDYLRAAGRDRPRAIVMDAYVSHTVDTAGEERLIEESERLGNVLYIASVETSGNALRITPPLDGVKGNERLPSCHAELLAIGVVRLARTYIDFGGSRFFAVSLRTLSMLRGRPVEVLDRDPPEARRPWYLPGGETVKVGEQVIPLVPSTFGATRNGLYINWYRSPGMRYFTTYRFEDVVAGRVPSGALSGKVIILGSSFLLLKDFLPTPLGVLTGSAVHGIMLRNLLDNRLFFPVSSLVVMLVLLVAGITCACALPRMKPLAGFGLLVAMSSGLLAASLACYLLRSVYLPVVPGMLIALCCYGLISLIKTRELDREFGVSVDLMEQVNLASRGSVDIGTLITTILQMICTVTEAHAGWVQIIDGDGVFRLDATWNCGVSAAPRDIEGGLCRKALDDGRHSLARYVDLEPHLSAFEKSLGLGSLLCIPLQGTDRPSGVIALGKRFPRQFTEHQVRQLLTISIIAGSLMENVKLNRKIQAIFIDSITSLAHTIDARDPYTFGHSERVAAFSTEIARRMSLPAEELRRIEMAGVLHDIGKIGVPEDVLRKSSKLTDDEFKVMASHPDIAVKILQPLDELYSLIPLVSAHHEKLDGTGYPHGLDAASIPLGAKILAVADVYDALTSDRPYRMGSAPSEAFRIIREHFAAHLDLAILDVLEGYVKERDDYR